MNKSEEHARYLLRDALSKKRIVFLTGAGVSAESGIPTFRGYEGRWTVGSRNYTPEEMATLEFYNSNPLESWRWYMSRFHGCLSAKSNPGHFALAAVERRLGERFGLITQNVDNLHLDAGNTRARTTEIHGSILYQRCRKAVPAGHPWLPKRCKDSLQPIPWNVLLESDDFEKTMREYLVCPECGALTRPHVLWFDEEYLSSSHFRYWEAMDWLERAGLLIIAGCSGTLFLANHMVELAESWNLPMIIIDPEQHEFVLKVERAGGIYLPGTSADWLPALLAVED